MPIPLADPSPLVYVLLALLAVVAVGLAARFQTRGHLIRAGVATALLLGLFLCDRFAESPREEAERKIRALAAAVTARDQRGFLAEVSESFDYRGKKKADLGNGQWWAEARRLNVTATVSGFDRDKTVYQVVNGTPAVLIAFDGLGSLPDGARMPRHFTAQFVRDPDGQYRLRTFTPYNYVTKKDEEPIPGL